MRVTVVGGGIIGLTSAYYLSKEGYNVTVIDKGNLSTGCSFGNAGYICPSHFVPLASPGIITQGIKWMFDSKSPFYIKPRLDMGLMKWGLSFWKSSFKSTSDRNTDPLHQILQYSRLKMLELSEESEDAFDLKKDGCLMMYRKDETAQHEAEMAKHANELGIATTILDRKEIKEWEPTATNEVLGGVHYSADCHINPMKYMDFLVKSLTARGVKFVLDAKVIGFTKSGGKVLAVKTDKGDVSTDQLVVATGAWLPELTSDLGVSILLQAGKGYSITYDNAPQNIQRPTILVDDRVALTPFGNKLRVGGTMEIAGLDLSVNMERVEGIVAAVNTNFNLSVQTPNKGDVWSGLRPCSPDGLPYIGRTKQYTNLVLAGGHAMLGISLAAGTGQLVKDLVVGNTTAIDLTAFDVERF